MAVDKEITETGGHGRKTLDEILTSLCAHCTMSERGGQL